VDDNFWQTLPDEFDAKAYRSLYQDLVQMTDAELLTHYENYGRREGRIANSLRDRNDFVALVPKSATALEIGPFTNPLRRSPNTSYFDILSQEALVARATSVGLDPSGIPHIDYSSSTGDLSVVDRRFDVVISSHCLEHQPDLVGHLQKVAKLLLPRGAFFLLVPDKRYCFDHFIPLTNIAEIAISHYERRRIHTLRSVIEHRALTTHNDSLRHWQGDHGIIFENFEQRLQGALREFKDAKGKYIDVHAWYFNPENAAAILSTLESMGLSQLTVQRVYPTRYGANEFWMILARREEIGRSAISGLQALRNMIQTRTRNWLRWRSGKQKWPRLSRSSAPGAARPAGRRGRRRTARPHR
jgi:SAM-dependent methyltransferase